MPSLVPVHAPGAYGPPFEVRPDDPRLPAARVDATARLTRFRDGMSDADFDRLVVSVARFHLRWLGTHT